MTNAEKFKTAEERYKAFKAFCFTHGCGLNKAGRPMCPLDKNPLIDGSNCKFHWLELEYKASIPRLKPCPLCGGIDVCCDTRSCTGGAYIICANCGCRTDEYTLVSSAIERWNRRVDS